MDNLLDIKRQNREYNMLDDDFAENFDDEDAEDLDEDEDDEDDEEEDDEY